MFLAKLRAQKSEQKNPNLIKNLKNEENKMAQQLSGSESESEKVDKSTMKIGAIENVDSNKSAIEQSKEYIGK